MILKHQKKKKKGNWLGTCCEKLGTSVCIVEKVQMSVVRYGFWSFYHIRFDFKREKKNHRFSQKNA